jgi:hypothetical protein
MTLLTFGKVRVSRFEILRVDLTNTLSSWDKTPYILVYKYEPLGESYCFLVNYLEDGTCRLPETFKVKLFSKVQHKC